MPRPAAFRNLALSAAIFTTIPTTAWAATYDPQVAYAQAGGKGMTLYVANADGTHVVAIATGRLISNVELSPAGGRVAFADTQGVKLVNFTATSTGVVASAPVLLAPGGNSPDFSADGSRILFRDSNALAVSVVSPAGGAATSIYPGNCGQPRWLRAATLGNAFACKRYVSGSTSEIWVVLLNSSDQVTSAGPVTGTVALGVGEISDFDVARTRDALLLTTNPAVLQEVDITTGTATARGLGHEGHFSADDSRIVSLSPHLASGDYVNTTNVATGVVTHFTNKGSYNSVDAKP